MFRDIAIPLDPWEEYRFSLPIRSQPAEHRDYPLAATFEFPNNSNTPTVILMELAAYCESVRDGGCVRVLTQSSANQRYLAQESASRERERKFNSRKQIPP